MCDGEVLTPPLGGVGNEDMLGPPSAHLKKLQPVLEHVQNHLGCTGQIRYITALWRLQSLENGVHTTEMQDMPTTRLSAGTMLQQLRIRARQHCRLRSRASTRRVLLL